MPTSLCRPLHAAHSSSSINGSGLGWKPSDACKRRGVGGRGEVDLRRAPRPEPLQQLVHARARVPAAAGVRIGGDGEDVADGPVRLRPGRSGTRWSPRPARPAPRAAPGAPRRTPRSPRPDRPVAPAAWAATRRASPRTRRPTRPPGPRGTRRPGTPSRSSPGAAAALPRRPRAGHGVRDSCPHANRRDLTASPDFLPVSLAWSALQGHSVVAMTVLQTTPVTMSKPRAPQTSAPPHPRGTGAPTDRTATRSARSSPSPGSRPTPCAGTSGSG